MAETVIEDNIHFLRQGIALARQLDGRLFRTADGGDPRRTVGCQLRHVIEHYGSFLAGLSGGAIDYDRRPREVIVEEDRHEAATRLERIAEEVGALPDEALGRVVTVKMDTGAGDEASHWSGSTVKRELQFLLSHTVHHYALIALLLAQRGHEVGADFGVAPSTLRHWRREAECAPQAG